MYNFNVLPLQQKERLDICKKCKWFNDGWCGTPIIGNTVEAEENNVTYYKEKIKLCGCKLDWKTKYRFTSCPAGKWHALNWSEKEIQELDAFINKVHGAHKIEDIDRFELAKWFSRITGKHEKPSTCPLCINELISEFRRQLGKEKDAK